MKRTQTAAIVMAVLSLSVASPSWAQGGMGGGGGRRGGGGRMYDPKTVETVSGQVVRVEHIEGKGGRGRGYGVHLVLKTDKEELPVHLGPGWYIEKQGMKIEAKDTIEVHGSRVTYQGQPAIIAATVKKGDQVLKLRDDNGVPAWGGGGKRGGARP